MTNYKIYDPATYITRDLWREVVAANDLRPVWAHIQAQKWQVSYEEYKAKCPTHCPCCNSELNYGIGRNHPDERKNPENTPSTDHIIPRSIAPELEFGVIDNLQVICLWCNTLKNNTTYKDIPRVQGIIKLLESTQNQYEQLMSSKSLIGGPITLEKPARSAAR